MESCKISSIYNDYLCLQDPGPLSSVVERFTCNEEVRRSIRRVGCFDLAFPIVNCTVTRVRSANRLVTIHTDALLPRYIGSIRHELHFEYLIETSRPRRQVKIFC